MEVAPRAPPRIEAAAESVFPELFLLDSDFLAGIVVSRGCELDEKAKP